MTIYDRLTFLLFLPNLILIGLVSLEWKFKRISMTSTELKEINLILFGLKPKELKVDKPKIEVIVQKNNLF